MTVISHNLKRYSKNWITSFFLDTNKNIQYHYFLGLVI